jgi:hypothetical protein
MRLDLDAGWAKGLGPLKNEKKPSILKNRVKILEYFWVW